MFEKVAYIFLFLVSAIITGFAHHWLLGILDLSRDVTFFFSFGLAIGVMVVGFFEDSILWHGYFGVVTDEPEPPGSYRRLAAPPLSFGSAIGILSFLVWS